MSNNKLLSICMMVKDEEKNLPCCLEALSPLLEKDYVELIIVDTGSEDNTPQIAQQYTLNVYFHPWNNHFAEMRNMTISYASGEWVFIVDADEELTNPEELINLFEEKNISQFNTMQININNILSQEKEVYSNIPQPRFFRRDGFSYRGAIHEQPNMKKPVLHTEIAINHYGYDNEDKELMEKKFKRTSALLLNELEKDPDNIYYRYQLAKSYSMYNEKEKARDEAEKAYKLLKNRKQQLAYIYVFDAYAKYSNHVKDYETTIKVCRRGIELVHDYVDLYNHLAHALIKSNKMEEAVDTFKKYVELCNNLDNLNIRKNPAIELLMTSEKAQRAIAFHIINYLFNQKRYGEVLDYIYLIKDNKQKVAVTVRSALEVCNSSYLKDYYLSLKEAQLKNHLVECLEKEKKRFDRYTQFQFERMFADAEGLYGELNRIRTGSVEEKLFLVKQFLSNHDLNHLPLYYSDVLEVKINENSSITGDLKHLTNKNIKLYVNELLKKTYGYKQYFEKYLQNEKIRENDYSGNRVYANVANVYLLDVLKRGDSAEDTHYNIFKYYIKSAVNYIIQVYQPQRLRLIYKTFDNSEEKFYVLIYLALEALEKNNTKSVIKYIRESAEEYPYFAKFLDKYQAELFSDNLSLQDSKEFNCTSNGTVVTDKNISNIQGREASNIKTINKTIENVSVNTASVDVRSAQSDELCYAPVFIGGAGRSGTTLLRVMLNAHPNLCSGPEFKLTPEIAKLYNQMTSMSSIMKSYYLENNDINNIFADFISSFFEKFRQQSSAQRIVEKTPHNVLTMKELANIFPKAKFIHVIRDGRDVASSLTKMDWKGPDGNTLWYVKNIENAAKYWTQIVAKGLKDAGDSFMQDKIKTIKYEDLICDPEMVMNDILEFLGEEWSSQVLEYDKVERGYEPVESSTDQVSKKLYSSAVKRWTQEFTLEDKEKFKKIGGNLLIQLGYEKNLKW